MVAATAARDRTPNFPKMFAMWVSTVLVREMQVRGDPAVGVAVGQQVGDLALAVGQRADAGLRPPPATALARDPAAEPAQLARGLVGEAARARVGERLLRGEQRDGRLAVVAAGGERLPASSCARAASSRLPAACASRAAIRAARAAPALSPAASRTAARARRASLERAGQAEAARGHLGVGGVAVGLGEAARGQLGARQDLVPAGLERALDELQLRLAAACGSASGSPASRCASAR